jgi:hypothetical protein
MNKPLKESHFGVTFYVQSTGRYLATRKPVSGERLLHRIVWTMANGPVPDGHEIHHKNEDWTDNRLDNLECIDAAEHQRGHMVEKYKDPEFKALRIKDLESGRDAAKEWHSSPEGLEWHKRHGVKSWESRAPKRYKCECCGIEFDSLRAYGVMYCSLSCRQKTTFQADKTSVGICALCGSSFTFNKYRKQECCSRDCSNKARGLKQRGLWDSYKKPQDQ